MNTSSAEFNTEAYLKRIGYDGSQTASLETLKALHRLHPLAIPFENLNPFLGLDVKLDTKSLQQKLIHHQRGGYCYEQNLCFRRALETLGFSVVGLEARVLWNVPQGIFLPRTHMLLRVDIGEATYLADVGFGGRTLTAPLKLELGQIQQTPHEPYRLIQDSDDFVLQILLDEDWTGLYRFDLQKQWKIDYEVKNWYTSSHPESKFVNNLLVARAAKNKRYTLKNNQLKIHHIEAHSECQTLTSSQHLQDVLVNQFNIQPPRVKNLDEKLHEIVRSTENSE